jgi:hypothetical protein
MKLLARLPPREIEGADRVLDGAVAEVASGNRVRLWPAMTYVPETNQTRIAFFTEWRLPPTPEDERELIAATDEMMGKPPELITETKGDPTVEQENVDWLRTGKAPKPRRTN